MAEPESTTITNAEIRGNPPATLFSTMPVVWVRIDAGEWEELFSYYPDELSFSPDEFIGKTRDEGHRLKFEKDRAYLRS